MRCGVVAWPVAPDAAILVPLLAVCFQPLDAEAACDLVDLAQCEHDACCVDTVLDAMERDFLDFALTNIFYQIFDASPAIDELEGHDVVRQEVACVGPAVVCGSPLQHVDVVVDALARVFVIIDEPDLCPWKDLGKPYCGFVTYTDVPSSQDGELRIVWEVTDASLKLGLGHLGAVIRAL